MPIDTDKVFRTTGEPITGPSLTQLVRDFLSKYQDFLSKKQAPVPDLPADLERIAEKTTQLVVMGDASREELILFLQPVKQLMIKVITAIGNFEVELIGMEETLIEVVEEYLNGNNQTEH